MFHVEMLPAERGDAILLEYGPGATLDGRVLIDGGPVNSGLYEGVRSRLLEIAPGVDGRRHFDLLVVSHIDADHIEGVIRLLQDTELDCVFDDVWFNGWKQLADLDEAPDTLGARQGEFLGALLERQGRPWNQLAGGGPIVVPDDAAPLPTFVLRGGLELTLLSPTMEKLRKLASEWEHEVRSAGFTPGDHQTVLEQLSGEWWARPPTLGEEVRVAASADRSEANGSSIAFLAAWEGRGVLCAADAHDDVLTASLRRMRGSGDGPVRIDALKLSHHGSAKNTTQQLLSEIVCDTYLVSTNGDRFDHPDAVAIGTVIAGHQGDDPPVMCFNYRQPQTAKWEHRSDLVPRYEADAVLRFTGD